MQLKMHLSQIPSSQLKERGQLLQLWDYQTKLLPKHKAPGSKQDERGRGGVAGILSWEQQPKCHHDQHPAGATATPATTTVKCHALK